MVNRKRFLHLSAAGAAGLILPGFIVGKESNSTQIFSEGDQLAEVALNAARSKGVAYIDVRIAGSKSAGVQEAGIRILFAGSWGFASTVELTSDGVTKCVEQAISNSRSAQNRHQYDLLDKHDVWRCAFEGKGRVKGVGSEV